MYLCPQTIEECSRKSGVPNGSAHLSMAKNLRRLRRSPLRIHQFNRQLEFFIKTLSNTDYYKIKYFRTEPVA